jgi:uncharacterized protein (TIRG00374 family)
MPTSKLKSGGWFLAKAALSIAFLFYATRKIDLSSFAHDIRTLNPPWLLGGLIQLSLIPVLGGARWRLVLSTLGSKIGIWSSTRLFWVGMIFNQVLPSSSGGDAIRVVLAWRRGVPLPRSAHSVILERLVMVFTLVILVAAIQLLPGYRENIPAAAWFGPILLFAAVAGLIFVTLGESLIARLRLWRALSALAELSIDARKFLLSRSSSRVAGLSVLTHLNIAVASLWLGKALGIHLGIVDYAFYMSLLTLVTSLPVSIGGWGIREGAVVALFGNSGVSAHSALAFSILFGLSVGVISLAGLPFVSIREAGRSADEVASRAQPCST